MPYYRERFLNRQHPVSYTLNGVQQHAGTIALDSAEMMGFRTRPHFKSLASQEVSDISADPYAYFLESTSREKYQARLKERGLQPQGSPDKGHPMELKRHTISGQLHSPTLTSKFFTTDIHHFDGAMVGYVTDFPYAGRLDEVHEGTILVPAPYKETGLDVFAQQAYARTAPTSVVFDAANFLGELREGLPKLVPELLMGASKNALKRGGSDYLNVEFGLKPLINDLQNAGKALMGATELLTQQGQRVHRRYSLPPTSQSATTTFWGGVPVYVGSAGGFAQGVGYPGPSFSSGTTTGLTAEHVMQKTRSSRRWFEGEFSSFYPVGFDPTSYLERLAVLVNPKITPAVLWELAPWSWLVDWNLRIGDTIRANEMNANDLLVMHYGYAMEETIYTTESSWTAVAEPTSPYDTWSNLPRKGRYFASTTYKRRLRANPYGFRVGGASSLTGGQTAILGALGLTKLR